jgi:hypothetical protein
MRAWRCIFLLYFSRKNSARRGTSSRRSRRGGRMEAGHVEAVVEVLPEALVGDGGAELLVGGGDDADVDLGGAVLAQAADLALLDDAEQLGLEGDRGLGDLVEEEGPAVGLLEEAPAGGDGAGEGAPGVAEELALQQRLGDGSAVHRDKGPVAAAASWRGWPWPPSPCRCRSRR